MWLSAVVPLPSGQMNSHGPAESYLSSPERDIWLGSRNPPSQGDQPWPWPSGLIKEGKITEYGNTHLSIWIHHSANDGKSKSNGLKPKRQLLTHRLKSPKGEDFRWALISKLKSLPPWASLSPSLHSTCRSVSCFILKFHLNASGKPQALISWQQAGSWHCRPGILTPYPREEEKGLSSEPCRSQENSQHIFHISLAQRGWHAHFWTNHMAGGEPVRTHSLRERWGQSTHQATCPRMHKRAICQRKLRQFPNETGDTLRKREQLLDRNNKCLLQASPESVSPSPWQSHGQKCTK